MKLFSGFFGIAALTLAGCKPDSRPNAAEDSTFKTFEMQGMLREVSPDHIEVALARGRELLERLSTRGQLAGGDS